MCYNSRVAASCRRGQALLEYVLAFAALVVVVVAMWGFLGAASRAADRADALVRSDYP